MAEEKVIAGTAQSTPVPHYYSYDGNGNPVVLTGVGGILEDRLRYNGFGKVSSSFGPAANSFASTQSWRFSTKYLDFEVDATDGLLYYGYRTYSTRIGRWVSRDPIAEQGGDNLYGMVGNDAVSRYDYLGLADCCCTVKQVQ